MRARSALFTLFGDVVRPEGGEAWLSRITAAMGTLDFSPQAVRTALHRMAGEGWVEPRKVGRYAAYRLTERGARRLDRAAERIYRLRSRPWDGGWRLLVVEGAVTPDVAAELSWIGFGRLREGVWVSPHDHEEAGDLVEGVTFTRAAVADDVELAGRAWDLDGLAEGHRAFIARWSGAEVPDDPAEAFGTRLRLVHDWRKFLFLDPGLPEAVLPAGWPGVEAAEVFAATYDRLVPTASAWWAGLDSPAGSLATSG